MRPKRRRIILSALRSVRAEIRRLERLVARLDRALKTFKVRR